MLQRQVRKTALSAMMKSFEHLRCNMPCMKLLQHYIMIQFVLHQYIYLGPDRKLRKNRKSTEKPLYNQLNHPKPIRAIGPDSSPSWFFRTIRRMENFEVEELSLSSEKVGVYRITMFFVCCQLQPGNCRQKQTPSLHLIFAKIFRIEALQDLLPLLSLF
jgi:hypothetical protein